MSGSIRDAAKGLISELIAPEGAVSALIDWDEAGQFIHLYIDPEYWFVGQRVPAIYEGYSVVVEPRELALTH